jgi:hypothetical protein
MPSDPTSLDDFNAAAERREYEKARLPDILKRKVEYLEEQAEQKRAARREEQEKTREQDLAEEGARQRLEHPTKTYEDLTIDGVRKPPSKHEIEERAVNAVDRRNALSLAGIDLELDAKVDKVLALNREADAPGRDQTTPDLLSTKPDIDIGGDFYRATGPDRGGC